jgi:tetratricopeptide (TPR) repeat protein
VEIVGLEPRRSDLARGIVITRSTQPLDITAQRALWDTLGAAGVTEPSEAGTDDDDVRPRQWLAAPWLPPAPDEVERQRTAFERAAEDHGIDAIWCVKIETGIDGVAWLERAAEEAHAEAAATPSGAPGAEVDAIFEQEAEVLYSAPDAPPGVATASPADPEGDDPDEAEDDDDDDDDTGVEELGNGVMLESRWRNGAPPLEHAVGFPIERYPDIIDDYDGDSFGIALKLSGPSLPGEESVINAFFALWLSVYQDERVDEFEPFQRADVVHDRVHRSALMWVERFAVPATAADQVHFLLWVVARINEVLPLIWARFDGVDSAVKSRAVASTALARAAAAEAGDGAANGSGPRPANEEPFILAGNPLADRFRRHGEEAALAWAVAQSVWSRRELAGMLIEVALAHNPDDEGTAAVAERLLRRSLAFDSASDASGYLAIVLVRQSRIPEAIALARIAPSRDVRLLVVGEIAEHAPGEVAGSLDLLDAATLAATDLEELCELVGGVARHAPGFLDELLCRLPSEGALVPYLYNTSFSVERPQALAILRKVLALPAPARESGEARTALVMAWNNACIHAHALGEYRLAGELADGGQIYGAENPYIYHSAACAYAAVGEIDRALEQVARAIEHEYEHAEKMETDADLASLQADPRFAALFRDWRTRRADLN